MKCQKIIFFNFFLHKTLLQYCMLLIAAHAYNVGMLKVTFGVIINECVDLSK